MAAPTGVAVFDTRCRLRAADGRPYGRVVFDTRYRLRAAIGRPYINEVIFNAAYVVFVSVLCGRL